ncbi:MAG: hypothetical protein Q4G23_10480 [Clostridia bacterium]|nr:hypothetical protein [Clostridia bacterium]
MILNFIKKYKLNLSLIAGFIVLYVLSVYFLFDAYLGKVVLEINIFSDATIFQTVTSLLYVIYFFILFYFGKKYEKEIYLKLCLYQAAIMFIIPLVCVSFLIFGFETELGALIFSYIMLITMVPFTGFGIHLYVTLLIPVLGIILFILAKKELKKLA